ncbi:hypothetical protein ACP70R_011561 [Stipagrostis hirtigluma subsp. patula]
MATPRLKRKQPNGQGSSMDSASGSYSPPEGVFGLPPPKAWPRDCRKRSNDKPSWVQHTFTPHSDGHLWRKYGQKVIKAASFPRLYYRCSYYEDRKCLALKKVQQENSDDPPLFTVTYEHEHTCGAVPVPAPDVEVVVADAERPAASNGLVLRFSASGDGCRHDARTLMQQGQQQYNLQPLPPSMFLMTSFDSLNGQLHEQQHAFPSGVLPSAASWLGSFPNMESSPAAVDHEADMFLTRKWDSFGYCLEDQLQFSNHELLPGSSSGSLYSWETDGCSLAHQN